MFFLNSILMWGSLAAAGVAVPVVIHLLSRYRSRVVDWGAMELLRRVLVVRAARVRMEDLILLLLRCLAVFLLALALARPVLKDSAWLGESKVGVVLALDSSFSMGHNPGGQSRYDAARQRARDVIATLNAADTVTVVQLGDRPLVRLKNVALHDSRLEEFLANSAPLAESLNLDLCLKELTRLVEEEIKTTKKECYLITDGQACTWEAVSPSVREAFQDLSARCQLFFLPVGSENAENVAVTRLALASGVLRKGFAARYAVEVRNTGRAAVADLPVELFVDGRRASGQVIDRLGPGETAETTLFAAFPQQGSFAVTAQVGKDDPLALDNTRYAVAEVREKIKILCVEMEPSADPLRSETAFLYAAFMGRAGQAPTATPSTVEWETIAASRLDTRDLAGYDVVMLVNVPAITRRQAAAIGDFVRRGGGLFMFLGNRIDPAQMNSQMRDADGTDLLPAHLSAPIGEVGARVGAEQPSGAALGWTLAAGPPDHPITRFVSALPRQLWEEIRFQRYFQVSPNEKARVLLSLASTGDPILVERGLGRGTVLLFTSTADRDWTDFPVSPAYVMLLQEAVTYLARQSSDNAVTVSQNMIFPLPAGTAPADISVRGPGGQEALFAVPADEDGQQRAVVTADKPGIYALRASAAEAEMKMAANVDPRESSVAVLRGGRLESAVGAISARLIDQGRDLRQMVRNSRSGRELWRTLLELVLAALVIESLLSRWFAHRLSDESTDEGRLPGISGAGRGGKTTLTSMAHAGR